MKYANEKNVRVLFLLSNEITRRVSIWPMRMRRMSLLLLIWSGSDLGPAREINCKENHHCDWTQSEKSTFYFSYLEPPWITHGDPGRTCPTGRTCLTESCLFFAKSLSRVSNDWTIADDFSLIQPIASAFSLNH